MTQNYNIVPPHLTVKAMRDNGYKNAAYAIAELIDNSIQAGAKQVELLCGEKEIFLQQRRRLRIHEIAVLDNGCGMNHDVLRIALQFGNGTYLDEDKHTGIGRFGMGLPTSSVSQCKHVDVWSWQNGYENALYSYLDLDEIAEQKQVEVPVPQPKPIPSYWLRVGKSFGLTGTLVVWSKLDRCIWKTADAIIDNSEFLIGRIYRRFLDKNKVLIRMAAFDIDQPEVVKIDKFVEPNDPTYLMEKTSCPEPYHDKPMFEPYGSDVTIKIEFKGKEHEVKLRFSYAKEEARQIPNAGSTPYGKHAANNVGVSIVRADRELELDQSWVIQYDPRERWWGVEIDFPPSLDELFGVTNNKQAARNFSELAKVDIGALLKGRTITQVKRELEEEQDPRVPLIEIAHRIRQNLATLRNLIKAQAQSMERSQRQRYTHPIAESIATQVTAKRKEEGHQGQSDADEQKPPDVRKHEIEASLEQAGISKDVAQSLAASTVDAGLKYVFAEAALETSAFFTVKLKGGSIEILLNTNHPAYSKLIEVLERDIEEAGIDELKRRLRNALDALKLLLMSWARYEDEQPDGKRRTQVQDTRSDWGKVAREFLDGED